MGAQGWGVTPIGGAGMGEGRDVTVTEERAGCVTLQRGAGCHVWAVTKGCRRTEGADSLSGRGGVSEGIWPSVIRAGSRWARRRSAWRRAGLHPPAAGRGDGPDVHPQRAMVGICVSSMTHFVGILRMPLAGGCAEELGMTGSPDLRDREPGSGSSPAPMGSGTSGGSDGRRRHGA